MLGCFVEAYSRVTSELEQSMKCGDGKSPILPSEKERIVIDDPSKKSNGRCGC